VDKAIFPSLLASLWSQTNHKNISRGFYGTGLHPLDISKPLPRVVSTQYASSVTSSGSTSSHKHMKRAILNAIAPERTKATEEIMSYSKQKKCRIQSATGIIITDSNNINELRQLKESRTGTIIKQIPTSCSSQPPNGLQKILISPDGNCLFAAIAMAVHGNVDAKTVHMVRQDAVKYIMSNFALFQHTILTTHDVPSKAAYKKKMQRQSIFGDHEELLALCQLYKIAVTVYTGPEFTEQPCLNEAFKGNFEVFLHLQNEHYDLLERTPILGDWLLATYEGVVYPGYVQEFAENGDVKVSVLHRSGRSWVFPKPADEFYYSLNNIGRRIIPPVPIGNHEQMTFKHCAPV
jgi:hypothetical protein